MFLRRERGETRFSTYLVIIYKIILTKKINAVIIDFSKEV
jgi:hypothetical protein